MLARAATDALLRALRERPRQSTVDLAARLQVSRQYVVRQLQALIPTEVVNAGRAGRTRYAARRPLRGELHDLPVYAVDTNGAADLALPLAATYPGGCLCVLDPSYPIPEQSRDGWWDGLPYPIDAMRPAGYLGRQFARAEARELEVGEDPEAWSEDEVLYVLSRRGYDTPGNLIVGNAAYERFALEKLNPRAAVATAAVEAAYAAAAREAIAVAGGGSSAAGEFPKFTALRELPGMATPHVIVKFSGAGGSATERRWSDLLVCEHLALGAIASVRRLAAARTRLVQAEGRTFLEAERFDRVGRFGRRAACSLQVVADDFLGTRVNVWPELGAMLHRQGVLGEDDVTSIRELWWFGRHIANADMHLGNVSFFVVDGSFELAPTYDMLPMHYAPLPGGELPQREFAVQPPVPEELGAWREAAAGAIAFWGAATDDGRISAEFRATCRANRQRLQQALNDI